MRDNVAAGRNAHREGRQFEELFDRSCFRVGVDSVVFPMGCERRGGRFVPKKTPCDRILMADGGRCVFVDCKTWSEAHNTLSRSMLTDHQVMALKRFSDKGNLAGYVVWFRGPNRVVFFSADQLWGVFQNQGSLTPDHGIQLGPFESINPSVLFKNLSP